MKGPVKFLSGLTLLSVSFLSACLPETDIPVIEGNYCTVRDGITGLISSEVYIIADTSDSSDFVISNISGYPNSSEAYIDVKAYLVGNDVLRIPEYEHLVSNNVNLKIWGRGVVVNGAIKFEISTQRDDINTYELSLVSQEINIREATFRDEDQQITLKEKEVEVLVVDDIELSHGFTIPLEMSSCFFEDVEFDIINTIDNLPEKLKLTLFYSGSRVQGKMEFSKDDWATVTTVDFSLPIIN